MSPSVNQFLYSIFQLFCIVRLGEMQFLYHFNLLKIDSILAVLTWIVNNTFICKKRKWKVNKNYYTIVFVYIVILIFKSIHNDQNYYNYRNNDHKYGYYSFYHKNIKVEKTFSKTLQATSLFTLWFFIFLFLNWLISLFVRDSVRSSPLFFHLFLCAETHEGKMRE